MSLDANNAKGKKTTRAKPAKGKAPERLKCSLLLTRENDLRLTVLASLREPTGQHSSIRFSMTL